MNGIFKFIKTFSFWLILLSVSLHANAVELITYYHNDLNGSPIAASDESGNLLWREEYKPYGERLLLEEEASDNHQWYTGKSHDDDTGLTYMGARYYDPVAGRFMATDPVSFVEDNPTSFNRYAYANNNPYKYVDPNGEDAINIDLVLVGATVGFTETEGNPFIRVRAGITGLGISYDLEPRSPTEQGTLVGTCKTCSESASFEGSNIGIGVEAGLGIVGISSDLYRKESYILKTRLSDGSTSYGRDDYLVNKLTGRSEVSYVKKDEKSRPKGKKIGAHLKADFNYEWGKQFSWDAINPGAKSNRDSNF